MKNILQKVADFHKAYEKNVLYERIQKKEMYLRDSKEALFFIFSFSFYQGRRDKLSEKFEFKAKSDCDIYFNRNHNVFSELSDRLLKKEELKSKYLEFEEILLEQGLNKEGDRLMVMSFLNFIHAHDEKNILQFIINRIKSRDLNKVYDELDSIWSIGSKISSLILRDIVYIYKLEDYLDGEKSYSYLQPVDTWVHQVAKKLTLIDPETKGIYTDEEKEITMRCFKFGINPIHFNQGAWYLSTHSLDIVLDNLA